MTQEITLNSSNIKKYASFELGTMVQLVYKETGKGFVKQIRKNCKVIGLYDFHVLFLDIDTKMKISISKSTFFTDPISIVIKKNALIANNA